MLDKTLIRNVPQQHNDYPGNPMPSSSHHATASATDPCAQIAHVLQCYQQVDHLSVANLLYVQIIPKDFFPYPLYFRFQILFPESLYISSLFQTIIVLLCNFSKFLLFQRSLIDFNIFIRDF